MSAFSCLGDSGYTSLLSLLRLSLGHLHTSVHLKPSDLQQYLLFSSCHQMLHSIFFISIWPNFEYLYMLILLIIINHINKGPSYSLSMEGTSFSMYTIIVFSLKIHKLGNPGHSIIASPTECALAYIDAHFQTFVTSLLSYIKDTNLFLWDTSLVFIITSCV